MIPRLLFSLILLLFVSVDTRAQARPNPDYDSVLAKRLQANDMGMKNYVFVILKTGSLTDMDTRTRDSLFRGHMNNINRMAREGKLLTAGPFGKNDKQYRGVYIFNTTSIDEAKKWVAMDPAVQAGVFDAEYFPWFASAALMEINAIHHRISKTIQD